MTRPSSTFATITGNGESMASKVGGSASKLAGIIGGELGEVVDKVGESFSKFGESANIGGKLAAAGAGIAGLGFALQALGSADKAAEQQLEATVSAAGQSVEDYTSQIKSAVSAGEKPRAWGS